MPFEPSNLEPEATRRGVLLGVGLAGLAGTLSACGGSGDADDSGDSKSDSSGGGGVSGGGSLGKTSDIPVGGGKVFKSEKVVVTQPNQGDFKAFSAVCTHRGCTVGSVSDGQIHCPCHGSAFSATDGSVAHGPADKPLAAKTVTVQNGELKLG